MLSECHRLQAPACFAARFFYASNGVGGQRHCAEASVCIASFAGEWQNYDILFSSPRHEDGEKVANARMTVWHNGLKIHDDVEIDGPTTAAMSADEPGRGPILLQDHGYAVRYRNVWLSPR